MAINPGHHHEHEKHVEDVQSFGFWLYIMSDCLLFASLFATFIVLQLNVIPYMFDLKLVLTETIILLTSSFTFGLALIYTYRQKKCLVLFWMLITFLLGAAFLAIEMYEFHHLYSEGNSWSKSGYFSAFFGLVGTHGLHVLAGMFWMLLMFIQVMQKGITARNKKRLILLSLFWHFLDIIWIFVFSIVYLAGVV